MMSLTIYKSAACDDDHHEYDRCKCKPEIKYMVVEVPKYVVKKTKYVPYKHDHYDDHCDDDHGDDDHCDDDHYRRK